MTKDERLRRADSVGREFTKRCMQAEKQQLLIYWLEVLKDQPPSGWGDAEVAAWAEKLGVPQ